MSDSDSDAPQIMKISDAKKQMKNDKIKIVQKKIKKTSKKDIQINKKLQSLMNEQINVQKLKKEENIIQVPQETKKIEKDEKNIVKQISQNQQVKFTVFKPVQINQNILNFKQKMIKNRKRQPISEIVKK